MSGRLPLVDASGSSGDRPESQVQSIHRAPSATVVANQYPEYRLLTFLGPWCVHLLLPGSYPSTQARKCLTALKGRVL